MVDSANTNKLFPIIKNKHKVGSLDSCTNVVGKVGSNTEETQDYRWKSIMKD